jgi:hypothetical protein
MIRPATNSSTIMHALETKTMAVGRQKRGWPAGAGCKMSVEDG